jgi:phosphopantetheinyl transferase (holo-ACP synthase)
MAKVAQMTIPPALQPLLDRILAHFDNQQYPTWATRFMHTTRSAKKANKEKTYIPAVRTVWATLDATTKALWKSCSAFMQQTNYQYFTNKYSYCKKNGLDLAITPTVLHQMHGLVLDSPSGSEIVQMTRDDIVLTGQLSFEFAYKKVERDVAPIDPFNLYIEAYYMEDGENKVDTYVWEAPAGNVDWNKVSFSFGTTSRYYFHVICTWTLFYYDAQIQLDNFKISDMYGIAYREAWKVKSGKAWVWQPHYRKAGWEFYPSFAEPFYRVLYLE